MVNGQAYYYVLQGTEIAFNHYSKDPSFSVRANLKVRFVFLSHNVQACRGVVSV